MAKDREQTDLIVVHCSATTPKMRTTIDVIHRWHMNRGIRSDRGGRTGYHYVIERDGKTEQGRDLMEIGAHARGYNQRSVGVCLVGGVKRPESGPQAGELVPEANYTEPQWRALEVLVGGLWLYFDRPVIAGHNSLSSKACPCFDVEGWAILKGFH